MHFTHWCLNLRPCERPQRSKTGKWDEPIILDSNFTSWLDPFLRVLVAGRSPDRTLWPFSHQELINVLKVSAARTGVQTLTPCLYALRHGGASHDALNELRPLQAIKERGRWANDESLRRYKKAARAQAELAKLPDATLALGHELSLHIEKCFHEPALLQTTREPRPACSRRLPARRVDELNMKSYHSVLTHMNMLFDKTISGTSHTSVFLELFSGVGRVAAALRKHGAPALDFEINKGALFDLCNQYVLKVLSSWIVNGQVKGIWFGTPCTTWSIACKPAARDLDHIWGRPTLPPHRLPSIELGNKTLHATCRLIRLCITYMVLCILENPDTSMIFKAPPLVQLAKHSCSTVARCCVCFSAHAGGSTPKCWAGMLT